MNLEQQWQTILMLIGLLMSRMLVAFSIIPLFAGNSVPGFVRVVFVAGLSCALVPLALADQALAGIALAVLPLYVAKEAAVGLVLGLLASVGFWALYVAGTIIEYQAGLTFASTVDPLSGQNDSLVGGLLLQLFTALFLLSGGLLSLIALLFDSYTLWPLSRMAPALGSPELVEAVLAALLDSVTVALKVAAPFVILMLMVEIALGWLARFAPQLNVFFVALPLKALVLVIMLLLYGMVLASSTGALPFADLSGILEGLRHAAAGAAR